MKEFCALGDDDPSSYRIYPLHQLFYDLKEEAVKNSIDGVPFHSIHIAEAHLNRDQYVYLKDTACTVSSILYTSTLLFRVCRQSKIEIINVWATHKVRTLLGEGV